MTHPQPPQPGYQQRPGTAAASYGTHTQELDRPRKNPLGLAALIIGGVIPVFGLVWSLLSAITAVTGNYGGVGFIGAAQNVLAVVLGLMALGLGIAGLLRKNSRRAAAGAGTALGAVAVVGVLNGLIYTVVYSLS